MKEEERIAKKYLENFSKDIVYEPDGKIPPDFKMDQVVAIEVRRLNKNIIVNKRRDGLEQDRCRLEKGLTEVLEEFISSVPADNYRIKLRFARPIPKIGKMKSLVKMELHKFLIIRPEMPFEIKLSRIVSIILTKDPRKSTRIFHIALIADGDSGGWTGQDYLENINLCIQEKTDRIQNHKSKYLEWWLVLVDLLMGGIGEPEKSWVMQHINMGPEWRKLVVIHPVTKEEILKIGSSGFIAD